MTSVRGNVVLVIRLIAELVALINLWHIMYRAKIIRGCMGLIKRNLLFIFAILSVLAAGVFLVVRNDRNAFYNVFVHFLNNDAANNQQNQRIRNQQHRQTIHGRRGRCRSRGCRFESLQNPDHPWRAFLSRLSIISYNSMQKYFWKMRMASVW